MGFYWNFALLILIVSVVYLGSFFGLKGIAFALIFLVTILIIPSWYFLIKPLSKAALKEYLIEIIRPSIFFFLLLVVNLFLINLLDNLYIRIISVLIVAFILTVILNKIFNINAFTFLLNEIRKIN